MNYIRVIPILLLKNGGLVKTIKFKNPNYIGDPINAVRIFNEKEVDEIVILDIDASKQGRQPDFDKIWEIATEAFMPFAYGGGITTVEQAKKIIYSGAEKIVINTSALKDINLISHLAKELGNQSVVVSVDVKKNLFGKYKIYSHAQDKTLNLDLINYLKQVEEAGAGEIMICSVDRDGTFAGYDLNLIKLVSSQVSIPVIACGGAGKIEDFALAVQHGASAVAAGSMFVYVGKTRGILINYPDNEQFVKVGVRRF